MSAQFGEIEDIVGKLKSFLYKKLGENTEIYVDITLWDDKDYEIKVCHTGKDFLHRAYYHHGSKECTYDKLNMKDVDRRCSVLICIEETEDIVL